MVPDGWRSINLGELTVWTSGGTPSKNVGSYWGGDVPWISAVSMKTIRISDSRLRITEAGLENGSRLADRDSVLLLVRGSELHKRVPIGIATRPVAFNQDVKALQAKQGLLPEYLLYWLVGNESLLLSKVEHTGIGAGKLDTDVMKRLPIQLPPLHEQQAITRILSTIDDKIELNQQMNATLEGMARTLFKSWFIEFDPVRSKSEGRAPGLPEPIAALFPDSFEDSEGNEVPRGWRLVPLPDAIEVNPSRLLRRGEVAPYLDMANMPTRGHFPDSIIPRPFGSGMRFTNGDTLLARITPCLENGKTAYVDFLEPSEIGWGSTEYIVLRPKSPLPPEYAYCLARSSSFRKFAIRSMTGSSGRQRVPAEALTHFRVAVPSDEIAAEFGKLASLLMTRASTAAKQSGSLATLRDTLLPKLISGELRLGDFERIVGAER